MAHILCMTSGLTGILHASYEVVARLEAAGHRVSYACPHEVRERVEAQGIAYHQLPAVNFSPAPALPLIEGPWRVLKKVWLALHRLQARREAAVTNMAMDQFEALLEELRPDLLLMDMELHDHIITAVAGGHHVVLMSPWFCSWRRPGLPPIDSPVIPGKGFSGSPSGRWLIGTRSRVDRWLRNQKSALRSGFVDRRSILRYYARSVGFPMHLLESGNWPPPYTYDDLTVLSLASGALEFPHAPRPGFHHVGPVVSIDRVDPASDSATEERLDALLGGCSEKDATLIVCTVTTMDGENEDLGFIQRLAEAVRDRPDWTVIVAMGGSDASRLGPLPTNVHAFSWVPQARLLASADLSINHGGIHTINECLYFGVPMLIFSGGRHDQPGTVARVAWAGLGHTGDRASDDVSTIAGRIDAVLSDQTLRRRVLSASAAARSRAARERLALVIADEL